MAYVKTFFQLLNNTGKFVLRQWWGRSIVGLMLGVSLIGLLNQQTEQPPLGKPPLTVEAACELIYTQQGTLLQDSAEKKKFSLILSLPDGTPIPGVCLTFTQDLGPGVPPVLIGTCTTDADGWCGVEASEGIITVRFGNTTLGGLPVDSSQVAQNLFLTDAYTGGINFYFIGEGNQRIVANMDEEGHLELEHASVDENGNLVPIPVGPEITNDWGLPPTLDTFLPPLINTEPPEGIVIVRFYPLVLRTTDSFNRAYCYYSTPGSGFARVPPSPATFIPGGGTYFDLSLVMNGQNTPAQILTAETDTFDIATQCWGWQGEDLTEIGTGVASVTSDQWINEILTLSGEGFTIDYTLRWYGLETEPLSPILPDFDTVDELTGTDGRFTLDIEAPTSVLLQGEQLAWSYDTSLDIGGFRVYRNDHLIGSVSAAARGWTSQGLFAPECGDLLNYRVTAFAGGLESIPSAAVVGDEIPCVAEVTVMLDQLTTAELQDCDASGVCGTASEAYGYFNVNGKLIAFGRQPITPQYMGLQGYSSYQFDSILAPFSTPTEITANISADDALTIEVVLFDHDANTNDDLLCSWSQTLPPQTTDAWLSQDGTFLSAAAVSGEGQCNIQVRLSVEVME